MNVPELFSLLLPVKEKKKMLKQGKKLVRPHTAKGKDAVNIWEETKKKQIKKISSREQLSVVRSRPRVNATGVNSSRTTGLEVRQVSCPRRSLWSSQCGT